MIHLITYISNMYSLVFIKYSETADPVVDGLIYSTS